MRAIHAVVAAIGRAAAAICAEAPTPPRALTDPRSIVSAPDPAARPVPLDDPGYSRGLLSAAWSADGRQLFLSTNLTGRYDIRRTNAGGSWPVQLTQAEDRQSGIQRGHRPVARRRLRARDRRLVLARADAVGAERGRDRARGRIAEVACYPAEGHGFARRENQVDALKRTIAWFDTYLKPAAR